jgi:DNA repair protein RadC
MNGTILYTTDVNALTDFRPATLEEIMTAARQALSNRVRKGTALTSPQLTRDFLTLKLGAMEHEVIAVILLDGRHRVIEYVELLRGTIDGINPFLDVTPGRTRGTPCHCPDI